MRLPPLILLAGTAIFAGWAWSPADAGSADRTLGEGPVHLLPFGLMHHIREREHRVPMQVQVYHAGAGSIHLQEVIVRGVDGRELDRVSLYGERLVGDGGALFDVHRLLEQLPLDISHRRGDRMFLEVDEIPELDGGQIAELAHDIEGRIHEMRDAGMAQARNLTFHIDLAELFPASAQPGDEAIFDIELLYSEAGNRLQSVQHSHTVQLLPTHLGPPAVWQQRYSTSLPGGFVAGDLHVHNCRDQATLGCPNCAAESFNVTGAFTNQQLRDQFRALGYDWFSTTTHSYCIQGSAEFANIASEAASLDLPDFVVLLGAEMTNKEDGPQQGSDIFDATCALGGQLFRGIAHMGGHGITSDKPGGQDYFLGACDGPIRNQDVNVSETNAEGGFAIANHPGGDTISFNSVARFKGMEANQTRGVEIWNYDVSTGAASVVHKNWWISRLLEGKITYPYSGSDTHDEAVEFGATITYIQGALNDANVLGGLKAGRSYISNGPFLYNNLSDSSGRELLMGDIFVVAGSQVPPNYGVTVDSYYNLGTDVATVRVYRGAVGASDEELLATYSNVTGQGLLQTPTTIPKSGPSWYRTELEVNGAPRAAYATPCYIYLR